MAQDKKSRSKADDLDVPDSWTKDIPTSPSWWAPTFVALMVIGLVWMVVYYFSSTDFPIPGIGVWNLVIGIGFLMAGFLMTLKWK